MKVKMIWSDHYGVGYADIDERQLEYAQTGAVSVPYNGTCVFAEEWKESREDGECFEDQRIIEIEIPEGNISK